MQVLPLVNSNITEIVGIAASVTTFAAMFTGLEIVAKILRKGNTSNVTVFPYIIMFMGAVLWLKYAVLTGDRALLVVNCIAFLVNMCYVIIFYLYTPNRIVLYRQIGSGLLFIFMVLILTKYFLTKKNSIQSVGLMAAVFGILGYASPLVVVVDVIKHKTTEKMPFALCVFNVLCAIQWIYYGYLRQDRNIQIPNSVGLCMGAIQMTLFGIYPRSRPKFELPFGIEKSIENLEV